MNFLKITSKYRIIPADSEGAILPGAKSLLEELSKTDNLIVLYTGNSPGL
jgi:hypothetical protein